MGHKKANCPRLSAALAAASVVAPTPATSRVADGWKVKAEVPVVRSRAFQLTAEEARATPVVTGSFHVNGIPVQVLFDSVPPDHLSLLRSTRGFLSPQARWIAL